jgi:RHS repeat-associated protein
LEDRLLLAKVFWSVDADGFWDVASNWKDEFGVSRLPTSTDDVHLDRPFTVTHRQNSDTVQSLHASTGNLTLSGGSLTLSAASNLDGAFTLSGGTMTLGGELTTAGTIIWSGGFLSAGTAGLKNTGTMSLTTASTKSFSGNLNNAGTILHTAGSLSDGFFNNLAGGTYDLQGDFSVPSFTSNAGLFTKSAGTGAVTIGAFTSLGGTLDVRMGTLTIDGKGTFNSSLGFVLTWTGANFLVAQGATVNWIGSDAFRWYLITGDYTGSGEGSLFKPAGTDLLVGAAQARFNFDGDLFQWTGGKIDAGSSGLVNEGTITLASSSTMTASGTFSNRGNVFHTGGGWLDGSTFINETDGLYELRSDAFINVGSFINRGTLRKAQGALSAVRLGFSNEGGTIEVKQDTFRLTDAGTSSNPGGLSTGGTFIVDAGAFLDLTTPGFGRTLTGAYTGSGLGKVRLSTGFVSIGATGATFTFPPGMFEWSGGSIGGGSRGLNNAGYMSLLGGGTKAMSGILNNAGNIEHNGGALSLGAGAALNILPGSTYDLQGDFSFTGDAAAGVRVINNEGTLLKSSGTGISTNGPVNFNNNGGTIDIRSGTFRVQKGGGAAQGSAHTGGRFIMGTGAVLEFVGGDSFISHNITGTYTGSGSGHVRFTSGTLTVGATGATFDFPDGLFEWIDGRIDATPGALTNRGSVTLPAIAFQTLLGTLNNEGVFSTLNDASLLLAGNSGVFNNQPTGLFDFRGDDGGVFLAFGFGGGGVFNNFGTVRKSMGNGTTAFTIQAFSNAGTLEVAAGTMRIQSAVAQVTGSTLTGGTWIVRTNSTLDLASAPNFTSSNGAIVLDGPNANFARVNTLTRNTGSFTLLGGRDFSAAGGLVNTSVTPWITRRFNPGLGLLVAAGFDPATGEILVYDDFASEIRRYTPSGAEVLPRIPRPGTSSNSIDLDFASPSQIGGTIIPAGTRVLLAINGDNSPQTLYALDPSTGAILASLPLTLAGQSVGGAYHAALNTYFEVEWNTDVVREINLETGAVIRSFPVRPAGSPAFDLDFGDVEIDPATGNLLVVGSPQVAVVRELSPTGIWIRDHDFTALGLTGMSGIALDEATGRLWVSNINGNVYELDRAFATSGVIAVGPGSTLTVNGPYTQSVTGTLHTQIGGTPLSGLFGNVVSSGAATLDGTLDVALTNGFGPITGQSFEVMTYPSHNGTFASYTGLRLGRFPLFDASVEPARVVLNAQSTTADLKFDSFNAATFPTTGMPGQNVTLSYTIKNLSDIPATGDWIDSVYLSRDGVLDPDDALLARVQHTGGVAGMATYSETVTAALPSLADGAYRVIVLADSRGLMPDADRANNQGASTQSIALSLPTLTLGVPVTGTIAPGRKLYYKVLVLPGKDLKVMADFGNSPGAEVYVRYNELPDETNFDQRAATGEQRPRLLLANTQGGSYYILLRGRADGAASLSFTLTAETAGFEIVSFTPDRGSSQGNSLGTASISLTGSQFTAQTTLTLRNASGDSRAAQSVQFIDANHLTAIFDLRNEPPGSLPLGSYNLIATDGANTAVSLDTFQVTDAPPGLVSVLMSAPRYVRVGRTIGVQIDVINGNDTQAIAPLIEVRATNVEAGNEEKTFFGMGDKLPGLLAPLEHRTIGASFPPDPKAAHVVSDFELFIINPTLTFIDWEEHKESLRPPTIPADAWDAIWANLKPELGLTLSDFYALLHRDANALAASTGEAIDSVERLFQFELQKANGLPAIPVAASAIDAAYPAPGLPLLFGRDFGDTIAGRYRIVDTIAGQSQNSRLGRGWVDNFDIAINEDANGLVMLRQGGGIRFFNRNPNNGSYAGFSGDFASLNKVNNAFQLRETTGELTNFRTDGRLDYVQDTNGNRITAIYTGAQLTSLRHSNGTALTLSYNAQGRLRQVIDPNGDIALYEFDASGEHLIRVTTTAGTTEYTYTTDANGTRAHALASITFHDGTRWFFEYDSKGRLARQEWDVGAQAVRFIYDVASYSVIDAQDNSTIVFHDDLFRVRQIRDTLGRISQASYSGANNPVTLSAAGGGAANISYDSRGRPTSVVNPLGESQTLTYEANHSRLSSFEDALGHPLNFGYDANGNLSAATYADGTTEQYGYDAQGNVTRSVNRLGQVITYTFNSRGQPIRKDLPGGAHVDYTYNARGNLETVVDATGTTRLDYIDPQDPSLVTKITYPNGRSLQYTYQNGRRVRMTDQSGFTVNYQYDAAGRLEFLRDGSDNLVTQYAYNAVGLLIRETRGNGATSDYVHDDAGQLLEITHRAPDASIQSKFLYSYDGLGRRTSMTTLEGTTTYGYDGVGRLTSALLPSGRAIAYAYDAAGNRTAVTDNGLTITYTVNALNQYEAVGADVQTFDAAGNLVSSSNVFSRTNYRYDAEGRLISQITPQGTWTYEYDVFGNRIASSFNGVRTQYLVDPFGLSDVVAEYDGAGNLQAHYVHGFGLTSRVDASNQAAYYQFDAIGNTTLLTGAGGTVLNSYSYLPFGEPLTVSETVANAFEFVGEFGVMRQGSSVDYMRNRWYVPTQGRFTQADPIGLAGGPNLYMYVGNDPVSFNDPTGLQSDPGYRKPGRAPDPNIPRPHPSVPTGATEVQVIRGPNGELIVTMVNGRPVPPQDPHRPKPLPKPPSAAPFVALATVGVIGAAACVALKLIPACAVAAVAGFFLVPESRSDHMALSEIPPCPGDRDTVSAAALGPSGDEVLACSPDFSDQSRKASGAETEQIDPADDPNDIVGPGGFGSVGYISAQSSLPYIINFQNKPTAQGPAAQVVVTHTLDADVDLDTFELGELGFGDRTIAVPAGRQLYQTRIDLRATRGIFLDVSAGLDRSSRTVTWKFSSIDPTTLDLPIDPFIGFLPPDQVPPEGQGFVSYTVRPLSDRPSGTTIDAQASIIFDTNPAIATNVWTNTLDVATPTSSVEPLPAESSSMNFTVAWSGADEINGSGIARYEIFVSENGGPFTIWLDDRTDTSSEFVGQENRSYAFYSIATDNVGHVEADPAAADASIFVPDLTPPVLSGMPVNQTIEATGPAGSVATYTLPTATDNLDPSPSVLCVPPSTSTFPLGVNTVTCTASDATGNSSSASFMITVRDTTAPTLNLPAPITRAATGPGGAVVTYSASAIDLVDGLISVNCVPVSGSLFPVGTTTVHCSATDAHQNIATGTFTVTIQANTDLIPYVVRDDGDLGYQEVGIWTEGSGGFAGAKADPGADHRIQSAGTGMKRATWSLSASGGLPAGTYQVYVTWMDKATNATAVPYTVYDNNVIEASLTRNQRLAPDDGTFGGRPWESLGTFLITGGTVRVRLTDAVSDGNVVADAVLLVRMSPLKPKGAAADSKVALRPTTASGRNDWNDSGHVGKSAPQIPVTVELGSWPDLAALYSPSALSDRRYAIHELALANHQSKWGRMLGEIGRLPADYRLLDDLTVFSDRKRGDFSASTLDEILNEAYPTTLSK